MVGVVPRSSRAIYRSFVGGDSLWIAALSRGTPDGREYGEGVWTATPCSWWPGNAATIRSARRERLARHSATGAARWPDADADVEITITPGMTKLEREDAIGKAFLRYARRANS